MSLLKVPLLLTTTVCTYYGFTPPTRTPDAKESQRFLVTVPDWMTRTPYIQITYSWIFKGIIFGFAIAESVAILAQNFPCLLSERVLAFLLHYSPTSAPMPSFRLTIPAVTGCLLAIAGGLGRVWCHQALGRFFTWHVALRDGHQLVTTGPYSIVRHPGYATWAIMMAGDVLLLFSPGSFFTESGIAGHRIFGPAVRASAAYLVVVGWNSFTRMNKEDAVLRREFKREWDEWAKRTPYQLIPYVY